MGYNEPMLRSLGVVVFITIVGATAVYLAQRPTVARGDVLAADLVKSNPTVKALDCDKEVPIGMAGGKFNCAAEFKNGDRARFIFAIDRLGSIKMLEQLDATSVPKMKKTSDPWGD
jgi:hypothetical protein